jgi:hypothetical protein
MLTEQEVRKMSARRLWIVGPAMACGIGAMFLYLIAMNSFVEPLAFRVGDQFGDAARGMTEVALIFPAFVIFLLPSCLAARYADRFKTMCPACHQDLSSRTSRVLATRCCPSCDERVLEHGRAHSAVVYKRYQGLRSRRILESWLWIWPALGGLVILWQLIDRTAFQQCPQVLWIFSLIGAATAGWTWLRTFDCRFVPQLLASLVLLCLGAVVFWRA